MSSGASPALVFHPWLSSDARLHSATLIMSARAAAYHYCSHANNIFPPPSFQSKRDSVLSEMYFSPSPLSPPTSAPKSFRIIGDTTSHSKSGTAPDLWSDVRTRTSSITSAARQSSKGKEKETTESIESSSFSDPWNADRAKQHRLASSNHTSSRPTSADPSAPRRHGSILGAASDALSARRIEEEEEERQRLRDAAARSVGLGVDLDEPIRSRDNSLYDDDDEEPIQFAPRFEEFQGAESLHRNSLTPSLMSYRDLEAPKPAVPAPSLVNRRRAGSLSLSLSQTTSRSANQSPTPTVPAFPASHSSLSPFVQLSATLPKYYPPPSLFMMALSKQWKNRFVMFTTPSTGNEERELERLEINENSVVFVADEEFGGRRSVVKVGGVDVGTKRRELNAEETGLTMMLLQIIDQAESRQWINAIKHNVLGQKSIRAGLGAPSSVVGTEPRGDMDVMLSNMRMQGLVPSPGQSSPLASDFVLGTPTAKDKEFPDDVTSTPEKTSTVRSGSPLRSPRAITSLKGLFTGSNRSRSSSRATSPEPEIDLPSESFGSVGSSLLAMPSANGAVPSIGERARSPISSSPIITPLSIMVPSAVSFGLPESQLERRIVQNRTSLDWAGDDAPPPSPTTATPTRAMSLPMPREGMAGWRLYHLDEVLQMKLVHELELANGEDAPMSMASTPDGGMLVCGINSTDDQVKLGQNKNCRVFQVEDSRLLEVESVGTLGSEDPEDYQAQRVTVLSPDASFLAVAGTHDLSLLTFPDLRTATTRIERGEIYDVAFQPETFVVATTINLLIYSLVSCMTPEKSKGKGKDKQDPHIHLEVTRTIDRPKLPGGETGGSFRAARFNPVNPRIFYTIINTTPSRKRGAKSVPRQAYIVRWNAETWKVERIRKVGEKGVTVFDVSPNGKWLAYGSSNYTIGLLDAFTLAPLLSVLKAHEFPPTTLRFNPTSSLLVSGSADNTVRIISIPPELGDSSWGTYYAVIITIFLILFAIALQLVINGTI
ncbi:hypothetical protein EWM64_g8665 [Hericium alpestre]|uniref:Uncharacterized protein n=1 Tax=Hericium alpestre TaxID=135208 RepID=A0A4Y9ZMN7_9AGAM|nr:hypothetical protein EWM64_g8665 [Hericium alpestre]